MKKYLLIILIFFILTHILFRRDSEENAASVIVRIDLDNLTLALKKYKQDYGVYPNRLIELEGKYLNKSPFDPWGASYLYELKEEGGFYIACCVETLIDSRNENSSLKHRY